MIFMVAGRVRLDDQLMRMDFWERHSVARGNWKQLLALIAGFGKSKRNNFPLPRMLDTSRKSSRNRQFEVS